MGRAPMAQMSEKALAAAMRPNQYGSSTTGVKKSTVSTTASVGPRRYTAASSRVSWPARTRASSTFGSWRSTCARSAGRILQAQPAPWLNVVSRTLDMGRPISRGPGRGKRPGAAPRQPRTR